jgi:hypothetical protein
VSMPNAQRREWVAHFLCAVFVLISGWQLLVVQHDGAMAIMCCFAFVLLVARMKELTR